MNPSDVAAHRAREVKEREEVKQTVATLTRAGFVQALYIAADVMQNTATVAKSDAWKGHYRRVMNEYRAAAEKVDGGAKFAIKD